MNVALYMRVSTDDQTNENQRIRLEETVNQRGWEIIETYQDQESGAKRSRPGLDQMLKDARAGRFDLVLITKVDRISRSLQDLLEISSKLGEYNVGISFTDQPIDISSSMGKAFFQILGAFAELERNMIIERTKAGIRRAKRDGKHIGRPRIHHATRQRVIALYKGEEGREPLSMDAIVKETGLSKGTVHRIISGHKTSLFGPDDVPIDETMTFSGRDFGPRKGKNDSIQKTSPLKRGEPSDEKGPDHKTTVFRTEVKDADS